MAGDLYNDPRFKHPLPNPLTRRVVNYLAVFRLLVALSLTLSWVVQGGAGEAFVTPRIDTTLALLAYVALAITLLAGNWRQREDESARALFSCLIDAVILSVLMYLMGGPASGIGLLMVFTAATAAVMLPLEVALFLASTMAIVVVVQAIITADGDLATAGLYGATILIAATLAHLIARRVRDYRIAAEEHAERLSRLQEVNDLIIRRMRTGVIAVNHEEEIVTINESAWFLLGSPPSKMRELEKVSPRLFDCVKAWQEDPGSLPETIVLDGSQIEVVPRFVSMPHGQDIHLLVFLEDTDVAERRALELSASSLAKLSGGIAHEIRNPLATVAHAAQLLNESETIHEDDQRMVEMIHNQTKRMNRIVENILQLSRREKSTPELFGVARALRDFHDEFTAQNNKADVQLDLPFNIDHWMVMFDPGQLQQVLWKLMENAVAHAGHGWLPPRVWLRLSDQGGVGGYCVITVEDNGAGIPPDRLTQIFEPFYTTRSQGSGLGLYIARQLCEANQCELTVDSEENRGTRFNIRLTLTRGEMLEGAEKQVQSAAAGSPHAAAARSYR